MSFKSILSQINHEISIIKDQRSNEKRLSIKRVITKNITIIYTSNFESKLKKNNQLIIKKILKLW